MRLLRRLKKPPHNDEELEKLILLKPNKNVSQQGRGT